MNGSREDAKEGAHYPWVCLLPARPSQVEITSLKDKGVDDAHNIKGLEGELEEACTLIDCLEGDLQKAKSFASVLQEKIGLLRAEVNARQVSRPSVSSGVRGPTQLAAPFE